MAYIAVRRALPSDAAEACELVRRSITDLCSLDHGGDERTITDWLANKTPDWVSIS